MPLRPEDLSSDPAHLTEMLLASEAENARLRATIIQLKGMIFGSRSERRVTLIAEQLPLDLDDRTPGFTAKILAPEPANDDQSNKVARRTSRGKNATASLAPCQNICRASIC
jgi:hypothetical protein